MIQEIPKLIAIIVVVSMGMFALSANVEAQTGGNVARGASLADKWCQSCHIINRHGTGRAIDPAPPFPAIAKDPKKTSAYITRWLSTSHPQMSTLR